MSTRTRWFVSTLLVCVGILHAPAYAVQYVRQRTLTSPAGAPHSSGFGHALSPVGSNLAVGDDTDDTGSGGILGSVSLFDGATMALLRYIPAPTTTSDVAFFGTAVADYGGNLLVGSPGNLPSGFKAYIVDASTGAVLASLRDPNPPNPVAPYRGFGSAVAAAGARVLIGAPGDNPVGYPNQGSASLIDPFGSPGGALIFNLANPAPHANSYFGSNLAVLGDRLVVGAPGAFTGERVYEFDGSTGALLHTFLPPFVGRALATDTKALFVSGASDVGYLQVYRLAAAGTLLGTYNPIGPTNPFRGVIAVSDPLLLAGAPNTGGSLFGEGVAFLFDVASGTLLQTLPNPEPGQSIRFASSVAIVGKYLAITLPPSSTSSAGGRVLVYAPCGDDVVDPIEECDDGNLVDGDGCDSNCRPTGCGNGVMTAGEQCDDGNMASGDGCSDTCEVEAGFTCSGQPSVCIPIVCGNGVVQPGEACDDGNTVDGDCCSADCSTIAPEGSACAAPFPGECDENGHCVGIPTLSQWGVIVLSLLMLAAVLRGRRRGIAFGRE